MNAVNIIQYYNSLVSKLTSKTKTSASITDFTKSTALAGSFTVPAGWSASDILYSVLIFDSGYSRVIDEVTVVATTANVSWRQPLDSFITTDSSITISANPLAGVSLYTGENTDLPKSVSISVTEQTEVDWAMANKKKLLTKLVLTYDYSIVGDADYKSNYYTFLYGLDQIEAVIVSEAICSYRAKKTGVKILQTPGKDERLNKQVDRFKAVLSFEVETYNR